MSLTRKEALAKIEEGLIKIKQMFSETVVVKQKFADVTLQDGSTIQVDNLAINGKVTLNDLPVADGSYTLQDGTTIEVVGGIITEVSAASDNEPTEQETEVDMKTPEQIMAAAQKFATATPDQQQAMIMALMNYCFGYQISKDAQDAQIKAALDAYKAVQVGTATTLAAVQETMAQTFALVKEIGEEPIEVPNKIEEPLTAFQQFQASKRIG